MMKGIELMHEMFGSGHPSNKCKTCDHLISYTANRRYYKCEIYGDTNSEATDWRLKYPSCAMYNMPYSGIPIIEMKKHMPRKKPESQCDGRISLFEAK